MNIVLLLLFVSAGFARGQTGDAVPLKKPLKWEFNAATQLPAGLLLKSAAASMQDRVSSSPWQSLGPERLQSSYYGGSYRYSYVSGRVTTMAVDPTDSDIVYCGSAGGGLWKSTNGGDSWTPLTDNFPRLSSGSVAVDPDNHDVIYYATGEMNFNLDGYPGSGIYKSTDGGSSWAILTYSQYYTGKVAIAPSADNVIYMSGYPDVFKSTNSGASWTELHLADGAVDDIVIDPGNAETIYAAYGKYFTGDSTNYGIFKSTDGGTSWTKLTSGLPPSSQVGRVSLTISHGSPDTLCAGINGAKPGNTSADTNRAYISTDAGATWTVLPPVAVGTDFGGNQGWYNNVVAIDPRNPGTVYLGGIDLWKSTDAGQTWTNLTNGYGAYTGRNIHPDQHAIAFGGITGQWLYIGNDGGVWKTGDGGTDFTDCNTNLSTIQFYAIDADQKTPTYTVGGTQDNGTERGSTDSLVWNEVYPGDGGYTLINPLNSNTIYSEYTNGALLKSTDAGVNWKSITSGIGEAGYWTTPYVMSPGDTSLLYTATSKTYISTNGGTNWTATSGYVSSSSDLITTMSISPPEDSVIYAGISGYRGGGAAGVTDKLYVSKDSGDTWTSITSNLPSGTDFCRITADPTQKGVAYLAVLGGGSSHVLKTTDYGQTWAGLASTSNGFDNIPTKVICVDSLTGFLYAGTYWGVYASTDAGASWAKLSPGLPNAVVDDISIQYSSHQLRVGTHGRGVWGLSLLDVPLGVQLVSCVAVQDENGVTLKWQTRAEKDNAGFNILRRNGTAGEFSMIASYLSDSSLRGLGTSTFGCEYSYTDSRAVYGTKYQYEIESVSSSGNVSAVDLISVTADIPESYALFQNYPNPFNPSTTIRFDLKEASKVTLEIYNVLGQEVEQWNYGMMNAGRYNKDVNMARFASGVYFYRIVAEGNTGQRFVAIRKLMLMK